MTILNELGLDPGLDHLGAVEIFADARARGGRIESFVSWCGGLPSAEAADNPLHYKFSWSPRGALSAGLNPASWLENGEVSPGGARVEMLSSSNSRLPLVFRSSTRRKSLRRPGPSISFRF